MKYRHLDADYDNDRADDFRCVGCERPLPVGRLVWGGRFCDACCAERAVQRAVKDRLEDQ